MAGDTADHRALDATFGVSGHCGKRKRQSQSAKQARRNE
jgi:hypothetical protein